MKTRKNGSVPFRARSPGFWMDDKEAEIQQQSPNPAEARSP